jgi:hypothetical protein
MRNEFSAWSRLMRRSFSQRLGLTVGLVAAGSSGLVSPPSHAETAPPSVIFLLDNHDSMQDFPQFLPEVNGDVGAVPNPPGVDRSDEIGADGYAGLNVGLGCTDPALVSAMSWFDKDSPDPKLNGSIPYDSDVDFGSTPQFFNPNVFYQSRGRRVAMVVREAPASISYDNRTTSGNSDAASACWNALNWKNEYYLKPAIMNECISCLTTKGWWRGPFVTHPVDNPYTYGRTGPERAFDEPPLPTEAYRKWVVSGRVLNVRPPKFVIARKMLKEVIATASDVRMGVATFGPNNGWYDPPQLLSALRPICDKASPTIDEAALNRPLLMKAVNQTVFRNNERSVGEALFGLGAYFSSQKVDNRWTSWFQQPLSPGWGWPGCCNGGTYDDPLYTGMTEGQFWGVEYTEWVKNAQPWEGTGFDRSVCGDSQRSAVIVVTGGRPFYDNTVPITKMMSILKANGARHPNDALLTFDPVNPETNPNPGGVNYCHLFGATQEDCDYADYNWPTGLAKTNKNFMDDVAFFLSHTDLRGDMPGSQTVRTFVVGYGDSHPMLQSIALAGQGRFYRANRPAVLKEALSFALGEVRAPFCAAP